MSRANLVKSTISILILIGLAACASTPTASQDSAEVDAYKQAMEAATRPATPQQIATAERSDPLTRANFWGEEYRKDAANLQTTIRFMTALRGIGSHERMTEVATAALPVHPASYEIYLELGRSYMAQNKPHEAVLAFVRSADLAPAGEAAPLAALGVAFDQTEDHGKAQEAYTFALQRDPDRIATLSNYGLSLALSGDLGGAETQLRKAAALPGADGRVRQNLALVLGLQGRFDEMIAVDPGAPQRTVEANRQALRTMMTPVRTNTAQTGEPSPAPDKTEPMPAVKEADVTAEDMATPTTPEDNRLAELAGLAGASETETALRPRLRGAQGG